MDEDSDRSTWLKDESGQFDWLIPIKNFGKKRSAVWQHFDAFEGRGGTATEGVTTTVVRCHICSKLKSFTISSKSSTSGMIHHLRSAHNSELVDQDGGCSLEKRKASGSVANLTLNMMFACTIHNLVRFAALVIFIVDEALLQRIAWITAHVQLYVYTWLDIHFEVLLLFISIEVYLMHKYPIFFDVRLKNRRLTIYAAAYMVSQIFALPYLIPCMSADGMFVAISASAFIAFYTATTVSICLATWVIMKDIHKGCHGPNRRQLYSFLVYCIPPHVIALATLLMAFWLLTMDIVDIPITISRIFGIAHTLFAPIVSLCTVVAFKSYRDITLRLICPCIHRHTQRNKVTLVATARAATSVRQMRST